MAPVLVTPAPEAEETVTVSLAVGLAAGYFADSAVGGELRVEWQDRRRRAYGIGLAGGYNFDVHRDCDGGRRDPPEPATTATIFNIPPHCSPAWLLALRAYRVFHSAQETDHIAYRFGGGLGYAEGGLLYATGDAGVHFGSAQGEVDFIAVPQLALTVPITRGRAIEDGVRPNTTIFLGAELGMVFADQERGGGGLSMLWLPGYSLNGEGVVLMGAAAGGHLERER